MSISKIKRCRTNRIWALGAPLKFKVGKVFWTAIASTNPVDCRSEAEIPSSGLRGVSKKWMRKHFKISTRENDYQVINIPVDEAGFLES